MKTKKSKAQKLKAKIHAMALEKALAHEADTVRQLKMALSEYAMGWLWHGDLTVAMANHEHAMAQVKAVRDAMGTNPTVGTIQAGAGK